jgi:hypothetical protein
MYSDAIENQRIKTAIYNQIGDAQRGESKKIRAIFDNQARIIKEQNERERTNKEKNQKVADSILKSDMELSEITFELENRLGKDSSIQEAIVTKYIKKRIPILNDIIENSTNTEKNEKLYAKDILELLNELNKIKGGLTAGWNIEKIFKLDETFKNFKSGSESLEFVNISNLIDELKKCLENVKLDVNNIIDKHYTIPLNKLNDIINGLNNIQSKDYLVQEKYLKDNFSFKIYQDIIINLNKDINTNYGSMSMSEFYKIVEKIKDVKNKIKYTFDTDILERLKIIDDEINLVIKEERDLELLLKTKRPSKENITKLNNEVNSLLSKISGNINTNKQKEKDIIVTKEYNTNKTIKTTSRFKLIMVIVAILIILLIVLLIMIDNTPVRITLGILIPSLIGGSFYYYKQNKGYIQLTKKK